MKNQISTAVRGCVQFKHFPARDNIFLEECIYNFQCISLGECLEQFSDAPVTALCYFFV